MRRIASQTVLAAVFAVVSLIPVRSGNAAPIEKLVPEGGYLLLKVRSGEALVRQWRKTGYYALWQHPALGAVKGMVDQQGVPMMNAQLGAFGMTPKELGDLFRKQIGFLVQPGKPGPTMGFEFLLLIEAGAGGAGFLEKIGQQMKTMAQGADPFVEHGGVKVLRVPTPGVSVGAAAVKDFLVLASPFEAATAAVDRVKTPPPASLASGETFRLLTSKLGNEPDVLLVCDVKAVLEKLGEMQMMPEPARNIVSVLGVDAIRSIGASFSIKDDGIYGAGYLHAPGEKTGLLRLLAPTLESARAPAPVEALALLLPALKLSPTDKDVKSPAERREELEKIAQGEAPIVGTPPPAVEEEPAETKEPAAATAAEPKPAVPAAPAETKEEAPAEPVETKEVTAARTEGKAAALHLGESIPPDAAQLSSYRMNATEGWQTLIEMLDAVEKTAAEELRAQAQDIATKAGKGDILDLLGEFGSRVVMYTRYTKPYAEATAQQTVIFIEVKDHQAFDELLGTLRKDHAEVFVPEAGDKVNGTTIYTLKLPNVPLPMSYCVTPRYLALGSGGNALQDYLRHAQKKDASLADQARFKSAVRKLPLDGSPTMYQYSDPKPVIEWMIANVKAGKLDQGPAQMLPMLAPAIQSVKNIEDVESVSKLIGVQVTRVAPDDQGIHLRSYQPLRGDQ